MKNKYLAFEKNVVIATAVGIGAGALASKLVYSLTHNPEIASAISTATVYISGGLTFPLLHAMSNKDLYYVNEEKKFSFRNFKWKDFIVGQLKLTGGFGLYDVCYMVGRYFLLENSLQNGFEPAKASVFSDIVFYALLFVAAIPIGKLTGNIRNRDNKKRNSKERIEKPSDLEKEVIEE